MTFSDLIHQATLEKQLLDIFPKTLFETLKLPLSTHPTIYQGLPRYSQPYYPKNLFVKKEFSNLAILKKRCLDKALLSLYNQCNLYESHNLLLFTYVIPGGLGDYFAQQFLKKLLKKTFPFLKISTISLIHETAPLQCIEQSIEDHFIRFSSLEDLKSNPFSEKLLYLLRNASLILQIPTFYPYWDLLIAKIKQTPFNKISFPKVETIGEYGFINSKEFYPTRSTRCLGLHFLEYGLLLDKNPSISTKNLDFLLKGKALSEYRASTHFYFAYLCTEYGHHLYLYSIALYLMKDERNIDLCTPDIGLFLKAIENSPSLFEKTHIKEIQIYYKDKCCVHSIQETGKVLRIFHTGPLVHEEFQLYLKLSEEPVGIRGNSSLSEVISLNKAYFYDMLEHNKLLYDGLIAMARTHTPHALKLLELYSPHPEIQHLDASHSCAELMQTTPALEELKLLNKKISEEHCANIHLENMVSRSLNHYENSSLEDQESSLVTAFIDEKISFEDLISTLRKLIQDV